MEGKYGRFNFEILPQDSSHCIGHGEIGRSMSSQRLLIPFRSSYKRVRLPEFKSKDRIAKVVPVDDEFSVANKTDSIGDSKGGNGRRILRKDDLAHTFRSCSTKR